MNSSNEIEKIRLGWIPYMNMKPLGDEIKKVTNLPFEIVEGVPSKVNQLLSEGLVDVAPSSSICLYKHKENKIAVPVGVAAEGAVKSVLLHLQDSSGETRDYLRKRQQYLVELFNYAKQRYSGAYHKMAKYVIEKADSVPACPKKLAPTISFTSESETSVMLSQILYRLWFGEENYKIYVMGSSRNPKGAGAHLHLYIGDEALKKRPSMNCALDLGNLWYDLTGLPFVYAVWQSQRELPPEVKNKVVEAAELAEARMRVEPSKYLPSGSLNGNSSKVDLEKYWKVIRYRLKKNDLAGLKFFLALSESIHPRGEDVLFSKLISIGGSASMSDNAAAAQMRR